MLRMDADFGGRKQPVPMLLIAGLSGSGVATVELCTERGDAGPSAGLQMRGIAKVRMAWLMSSTEPLCAGGGSAWGCLFITKF